MTYPNEGMIRANFDTAVYVYNPENDEPIGAFYTINISINGVLISSRHVRQDIGMKVQLDIILLGKIHLTQLKGVVVRHADHGFAINFTEVGIEELEHLKNIVKYNTSNPELFFEQYNNYLAQRSS